MRRYFLASGFVSFFLSAITFQVLGIWVLSVAITGFLIVAFAALCLYPRYIGRIPRVLRPAVRAYLFLISILANLTLVVLAVLAAANFPPERPFQERLIAAQGTPAEQRAYYELAARLIAFRDEERQRSDLLNFLEENVVSFPEKYPVYDPVPNLGAILVAFNDELEEVSRLARAGDQARANEKYLRLWRASQNLVAGHGALIYTLIGVATARMLVDFHASNDEQLALAREDEYGDITGKIIGGLDRAFASAVASEYYSLKQTLTGPRGGEDQFFALPSWPLMDVHKTLKARHDFAVEVVQESGRPLYEIRGQLPQYSRQAQIPSESWLRNPVGKMGLAVSAVAFDRLIVRKEETKAKLIAFRYVAESLRDNNLGSVPTDPLTGRAFVVSQDGDRITIKSQYVEGDKPVVDYQFRWPGR